MLDDGQLPPPIPFRSQREFVREVLESEVTMRKNGTAFVAEADEGASSLEYREQLKADGSPSQSVSAEYCWTPGNELNQFEKAA